MALEAKFHPLAAADLEAIYTYIAQDSPANAIAFIRRMRICCQTFADIPVRGTARPDFGIGVRTVGFERRITIAFRADDSSVLILRILYGGRDVTARIKEVLDEKS